METSSRLDQISRELRWRGLPTDYVDRLIVELADHRAELVAELAGSGAGLADAGVEADRRLGDPVRLSEQAAERFRRRSFVGRHRILCLVIAPMFTPMVIWTALLMSFFWVTGGFSSPGPSPLQMPAIRKVVRVACPILNAIVPLLCASWLFVVANRRACGRGWSWVPCIVTGVVWAFVYLDVGKMPNGWTTVGIPVAPTPNSIRLCAPLALALVLQLMIHRRRTSRSACANPT